jgi:hypothetical protein
MNTMGDDREWTQDHHTKVWHWYGSGQFAHAACGHPPQSGSPYVSREQPPVDYCNVCSECIQLFELRTTYTRTETEEKLKKVEEEIRKGRGRMITWLLIAFIVLQLLYGLYMLMW